ncbi:MAG: EpsG family protein [Lachnospiraceae bacterium]|nr:EpsG family protein [Lachnospiraceae bacterium]
MGRAFSILFYMAITFFTCIMAVNVKPAITRRGTDAFFRGKALNRLYLTGIFAVLFTVSALRFGIGNDYAQYTLTAHEAYVGGYVVTETGFNLLVKLVYTLFNRECYEVIFAIFAFATLFLFLRAFYRDSADFSQSFFLFMTLGLYFQTFNTVRYYFALSVALCSMRYVLDKDYIRFCFYILCAALFHKSVLLVLPVYLIAASAWKRWVYVLGIVMGIACFAGRSVLLRLALLFYPSYRNTIYLEGGISLPSVLRCFAVLALYLWFIRYMGSGFRKHADYLPIRFYGQLNFLAFLAAAFFSFLPVVTRIVYYLSVSQLLMIPLMMKNIEGDMAKIKLKLGVLVVCVLYFVLFLLSAHQAGVGLLPYRTWLFAERYLYK